MAQHVKILKTFFYPSIKSSRAHRGNSELGQDNGWYFVNREVEFYFSELGDRKDSPPRSPPPHKTPNTPTQAHTHTPASLSRCRQQEEKFLPPHQFSLKKSFSSSQRRDFPQPRALHLHWRRVGGRSSLSMPCPALAGSQEFPSSCSSLNPLKTQLTSAIIFLKTCSFIGKSCLHLYLLDPEFTGILADPTLLRRSR
jgi:hypothetical protein